MILENVLNHFWGIFWTIAFLGGSIFVHELGHFLAAKKLGWFVPRFSIGFGPKLFSWKRGETEYRISLLPLGGYVALPQLGEMEWVEGKTTIPVPKKALTFSEKITVASMGIIFNLLLAFVIATILWPLGVPQRKKSDTIGHILKTQEGENFRAKLYEGDRILAVDGIPIHNFEELLMQVAMGTKCDEQGKPQVVLDLERNKEHLRVPLEPIRAQIGSSSPLRTLPIAPAQELIAKTIFPGSPAQKAGLLPGDLILKADGQAIYSTLSLQELLQQYPQEAVSLSIQRAGTVLEFSLTPEQRTIAKPQVIWQTGETQITWIPQEWKASLDREQISSFVVHKIEGPSLFFQEGDLLKTLNGEAIHQLSQFETLISELHHGAIERQEKLITLEIPSSLTQNIQEPEQIPLLGIEFSYPTELVHKTPWRQFSEVFRLTTQTLVKLFHPRSDVKLEHMMGPAGIFRVMHDYTRQNFRLVLAFVVLLNINLAFLNLLPLPVLDGGFILFSFFEKLLGRRFPQKALAVAQNLFAILLITLMVYVTSFDFLRWKKDSAQDAQIKRQTALLVDPYS